MLFLIPVVLFGLSALGMTLMHLRQMRSAYIWLIPALIVSLCLLVFIILPVSFISTPLIINWLSLSDNLIQLQFGLNPTGWGFTFLIISFTLSYFFTLPARLTSENRSVRWICWLVCALTTVLIVAAQNVITLVLAWTLLDFLDFFFSFFINRIEIEVNSFTNAFISRILSSLILVIATISSLINQDLLVNKNIVPLTAVLLFFAGLLRIGIFPEYKPKQSGKPVKNLFSLIMNSFLSISGFALWSHLPKEIFNPVMNQVFLFILLIISVYSAIMNFISQSDDPKYWRIGMICLGAMSVLSGDPGSTLAWAGILLNGTAFLEFYSARHTQLLFFPLLDILVISGLPLTIGFFALNGFFTNGWNVWGILGLLVFSLQLICFIKHIGERKDSFQKLEPRYQASYLFGLFLIIFSPIVLVVKVEPSQNNWIQSLWMGVVVLVVVLGEILILRIRGKERTITADHKHSFEDLQKIGRAHV
jgi:hypothetical protein